MRSHDFERETEWIHGLPGHWGEVIRFRPIGQKDEIEIPLSAGSQDSVSLFRSRGSKPTEDWYLVLSQNRSLEYVALQVIHWNDKTDPAGWATYEEMGQMVNSEQIEEFFGPLGMDLVDHHMARRLLQSCVP